MAGKTLILSFDMETDIGSWTSETQGLEGGTPRILDILSRHSVPATFLFTGREATRHPGIARKVRSAGHEIGCHTMYHENLGPPVYDVPVGSFALEGEIEARLRLATDAIQEVAGVRPVTFRAPRLFGSTAMVLALEKLGYLADSSFPSYYHGRDFLPYHPSRDDWSREGDLASIPVFQGVLDDIGLDDQVRDCHKFLPSQDGMIIRAAVLALCDMVWSSRVDLDDQPQGE